MSARWCSATDLGTKSALGSRQLSMKAKVKQNLKIAVQREKATISGFGLKPHSRDRVSAMFSYPGQLTGAPEHHWTAGSQTP